MNMKTRASLKQRLGGFRLSEKEIHGCHIQEYYGEDFGWSKLRLWYLLSSVRLVVLSENHFCELIQILQMWNEQGVAGAIIEIGKKMLNLETAPDSAGTMTTMQAAAAMATATLGGTSPSKNTKKKPGASKKPKGGGGKGGLGKLEKEAAAFTADAQNEELKALEAYILKLSQQGELCKIWVFSS